MGSQNLLQCFYQVVHIYPSLVLIIFQFFWVTCLYGTTWQNQQNECAPSKDSDQPGHPPSLIRVFTVSMKKAWVLSYPLSAQRKLIWVGGCTGWSEPSLGAQSLCWFCHVAAHMFFSILLQAGVDINAKDNDGWSPLHAAAHWGQEESCKILAENMCDMEAKNLAVNIHQAVSQP